MHESDVTISEEDFARELESLSSEARQQIEERAVRRMFPSLIKMMRPLVLGIEALSRATEANTVLLHSLRNEPSAPGDLTDFVSNVQEKIDQKQTINQQLFDALHAQMKDYRDGFLLEVMQKPVVRDLIDFFDLFSTLMDQSAAALANRRRWEGAEEFLSPFVTLHTNMKHTRETLLELLERMDVTLMPPAGNRLDKHRQRAISVVAAAHADEDMEIHEVLKPGFLWRDRIVRPEEVVVKKWTEGYLMAMSPEGEADTLSEHTP